MDNHSNIINENSIDAIDRSILRALQKNGRQTNADLAEQVGLSPAACHKRFKRLEADGIIERYTAIINPAVSGARLSVFIQITLDSQGNRSIGDFEREVARCPEVVECHLMTGDYDYLLHAIVRDATEFERLHRDVLTNLPRVSRLTSSVALRTVCRATDVPLAP